MPEDTPASTATTISSHPDPDDRLVPVAEAIRYRKRAQLAEQQLGEQSARLEELRQRLDETASRLQTAERRAALDALLLDADAADADAARTLAEAALASMETPDPAKAIDEVRRRRPYLFRNRVNESPALSPHVAGVERPLAPVEHAAEQARATGDRRDLLAYLRLRRR